MKTLWPFDSETIGLHFAQGLTNNMQDAENVIFHFIARCGYNPGQPILVNQQIVAVDDMQRDPQGTNEIWAITVPEGWAGSGIMSTLSGPPFWFEHARAECVYPHLSVNGI